MIIIIVIILEVAIIEIIVIMLMIIKMIIMIIMMMITNFCFHYNDIGVFYFRHLVLVYKQKNRKRLDVSDNLNLHVLYIYVSLTLKYVHKEFLSSLIYLSGREKKKLQVQQEETNQMFRGSVNLRDIRSVMQ